MIELQDWLAPLLGSLFLLMVPLVIALMCNTIIRRIRSDDLRAHEMRLDRKTLPNRKEDEKTRLKVEKQWDRIESYTRARNLCALASFAVLEANVGMLLVVVTARSPILSMSLLAVTVVLFFAAARLALRKPQRPIWATKTGYYRELAVGPAKTRKGAA